MLSFCISFSCEMLRSLSYYFRPSTWWCSNSRTSSSKVKRGRNSARRTISISPLDDILHKEGGLDTLPIEEKLGRLSIQMKELLKGFYRDDVVKLLVSELVNLRLPRVDKPGWIYIFQHCSDTQTTPFTFYKIGRTSRNNCQTRLKEWSGSIHILSQYVSANRTVEKIIHYILKPLRIFRYPFEREYQKHYISIHGNKFILDDQLKLARQRIGIFPSQIEEFVSQNEALSKLHQTVFTSVKKEIEWFWVQKAIAIVIISTVSALFPSTRRTDKEE